MKVKQFFAALLAGAALLALPGCSLARTDADASAGEDRLIGVLVTTEYLDLFDFEEYYSDHESRFVDGGTVMVENSDTYQGRIYATLTTENLTNEETGEQVTRQAYVFEGIDGIGYFAPTMEDEEGIYTRSNGDEGISDAHMDVSFTDEGQSLSLEGTVYVEPGKGNTEYYVNPVYQCADGAVYVTSGSGYLLSGDHGEGEVFSTTLDANTTRTEEGKSQKDACTVTLHLAVMFAPERIVLLQMDANAGVVSRRAYTPGALPERLELEAGTAYLVVETHKRDRAGEETVARALYQSDTETIGTFYGREDGICLKQWTQLNWTR